MLGAIWDRLCRPERYRQRAAPDGGFSVPMMMERDAEAKHAPFLVTNTRGQFVLSPRSREGKARYAFFSCEIQDEPKLLPSLYATLLSHSRTPGWPNAAGTVSEAMGRLAAPGSIILATSLVQSICGDGFTAEQIATLMRVQGHVAIVNGVQVLAADLPVDSALVTAQPEDLGVYTRVGDYLGVQLFDVRRTIVVVRPDDVAR